LKKLLILTLFLFAVKLTFAEDIVLKYNSVPVNAILSDLSTRYSTNFSFNESDLSIYKISINGVYSSVEQAVTALLVNLPFRIKKIENVIVITPYKIINPTSESATNIRDGADLNNLRGRYIKGVVLSSADGQRLPYAFINIAGNGYYSDREGGFTIFLPENIPLNEKSGTATVSYLGFNTVSVNLDFYESNRIYLNPSFSLLDTVTVKAYINSKSMQTGNIAGLVRVNYSIAKFLPGNGDNAVYTLLKMMPGVRSSGEPSFLSVWGSTNGESLLRMDGFRIFSLNNFNQQISSVNPFIVKEIVLSKGGHDATMGDASGPVVDIIGIDGNSFKPVFKANINNLTLNVFASAPVFNNSVVMASYRQTYYNLYDIDKLNPYRKGPANSDSTSSNEILIKPDYSFRDLNLRFRSVLNQKSNISASFYYAKDYFNYSIDINDELYNAKERNNQYALSINLNKEWSDRIGKTLITGYYSSNYLETENIKSYWQQNLFTYLNENLIGECGLDITHKIHTWKNGNLDAGISYKQLFDRNLGVESSSGKFNAFLNENLVFKKFNFNIGLRLDWFLGRGYLQPRFQGSYRVTDEFKINLSAGLYNQFVNKVPFVDGSDNYSFIWGVAGKDNIPVIKSSHIVLGASFSKKGWLISSESYLKNSKDIMRLSRYRGNTEIAPTDIKVKGIDVFIDKEINGSNIFISSTLSQITENPQPSHLPQRVYSPFEIKTGVVLSLTPFYFSSSLYYGSGYNIPYKNAFNEEIVNNFYNRIDLSLIYRLTRPKYSIEAGLSVLNIFNSSNYKYVDALPVNSGGQSGILNLFSHAVPFTPILSFQIIF